MLHISMVASGNDNVKSFDVRSAILDGVENAINTKDLVVARHKQQIITNVTLAVKKASINGMIGPSGSGKTTLMRAIVGVQKYQGKLSVLGYPAGSAVLRSKIGYVTQGAAVYGDLSVLQNLRYFAVINRASREQVEAVVRRVHLDKQKHQLVDELSGGQRARVSLAIALLGEPDLLVMDEPTVGLDPILRRELWQLFRELADSGKTLLISSHVMDEAENCDTLILIRDGAVLWNDTRQKLLSDTHTQTVGDAFIAKIGEAR